MGRPVGVQGLGVTGFRVGHFTDEAAVTGCTVVLAPRGGAVGGVDVRGAAPGTLGTDTLGPGRLVERAHAILLAGGSAFGLAAAGGVMRYLASQGAGFAVGRARVPIVAGAVIFDLHVGASDAWPDEAAGHAACESAEEGNVDEGSVGAGTGATVGKLLGVEHAVKGGVGVAQARTGAGIAVGAIVVVNALGDVVDPRSGDIVAGARRPGGAGWLDSAAAVAAGGPGTAAPGANTTVAAVVTDATLTKEQACAVASMAHDGMARATRPSHTMFDGDTVFVLASGDRGPGDVSTIGHLAAECVAEAIVRGVRTASGLGGVPSVADLTETG